MADTSVPSATGGGESQPKMPRTNTPRMPPDPTEQSSEEEAPSSDDEVEHGEIWFHEEMAPYHGAQALPSRIKAIARRVKADYMYDNGYPIVERLESASGFGGPPEALLKGVFTKFAVLARKPLSPLWKYYMDTRLFNADQWRGLTAPSKEKADGKTDWKLTFPPSIGKIETVKVRKTNVGAPSYQQFPVGSPDTDASPTAPPQTLDSLQPPAEQIARYLAGTPVDVEEYYVFALWRGQRKYGWEPPVPIGVYEAMRVDIEKKATEAVMEKGLEQVVKEARQALKDRRMYNRIDADDGDSSENEGAEDGTQVARG